MDSSLDSFPIRPINNAIGVAYRCTNAVFAGLEALVQLNIQTMKTTLSEQRALVHAAFSSETFLEIVELQTQQIPAAGTKTFAYCRHVKDIAAQTGSSMFSAMHEQAGDSLYAATTGLDVANVRFDAWDVLSSSLRSGSQTAARNATGPAIVDSAGNPVVS